MRATTKRSTLLVLATSIVAAATIVVVAIRLASDSSEWRSDSSSAVAEPDVAFVHEADPEASSPLEARSLANVEAPKRAPQPLAVPSSLVPSEPELASLEGVVSMEDRRQSLRGWSISGTSATGNSFARAAFVASDGHYRIDGIPPHENLVLRVKIDGELLHQEDVLGLPRGVTRHDLVVRPETLARGRVVDADTGAPVVGARVSVVFARGEKDEPEFGAGSRYSYTDTRADGSFELRGVPPDYVDSTPRAILTAGRIGHFSTVAEHLLDDLRAMGPIELRIGELGKIEGRLLDSNGVPIEGAEIEMAGSDPGRPIRGGAPCEPHDAEVATDEPRTISVYPSRARSDRDGAFRLTGVAHGARPTLRISVDGFDFRYRTERRFERCGEIQRIEIRLPVASSRIVGRVTRNRLPIEATITWIGKTFSGDTESDASGVFTLERVEAGRIVVTAVDSLTHAETSKEIDVMPRGRVELDLEITLRPLLRGVVRWPDGRPATGITVSARPDPVFDDGLRTALASATAITDRSGTFEIKIEDLTVPYRVEVEAAALRALGVAETPSVRAPPGADELVLELRK